MASSSQTTGRGASPAVYLSFYGPDLGPTFLSHLRYSLSKYGLRSSLSKFGFRTCLLKGIKIAIVIFSKNYASFSWCLNELRKIMEHREHGKLEVLPFFYSVDPTDVKTPRKSIHENTFGKDSAKVKSWRKALFEAGSLSGFCFQNHESEAEIIKSIVWHVDNFKERSPQMRIPHPPVIDVSCHVFLSFRGEDTRHTIISHLNRALRQKDVNTFIDSSKLEVGQERSQLFEALKKSRIAIVMFSKNYARSKWCLEELRIIMKRKEQNKLIVIPIFYRVSPEEVRLHGKNNGEKGRYQIAMEEMKAKYNSKMVKSWKEVLWKAGDLKGFLLREGEDEGNCVETVTEEVMKLLSRVPLEVAKCSIGINTCLKKVKHFFLV